jgi:hypothetical protein
VYREQDYVERCHCNEPAVAPCNACGRARCDRHLEKNLCNRCTQYIGREMDKRSLGRWIGASVTGTGGALVAMVSGAALFAPVIGIPLGVATFFLTRIWQRAGLVQKMGPALAASKGELPAATSNESDFPDAPPPNVYTGL